MSSTTTSTIKRTSQSKALNEWSKVFPRQANETYTSSVTFIKQLTTVAISTITHLKNAFPEQNYTIDKFAGLKLTILKAECENDLAQFLISSLTQAFEAFDKKYLHQLALCFYDNECSPDNLLEYYLFEYNYNEDGTFLSVRSSKCGSSEKFTFDDVRECTLNLLKAIVVMLPHGRLPEVYDFSMRLYYNDSAPAGYQAPGFEEATGSDGVLGGLKLGCVGTRFHRMQMKTHHRNRSETPATSRQNLEEQQPEKKALPTESDVQSPSVGSVRCECSRDDREPETMLTCRYCGSLQHAVCYGVVGAGPRDHCCVSCADSYLCCASDENLARASNRKCYAIFRRVLCWLAGAGGVGAAGPRGAASAAQLGAAMRLQPGSVSKLMCVLRKQGALKQDPPTKPEQPVEVVWSKVQELMSRYFRPAPADDVAARLLEESQGSQRSDPLTEVLSPMERVALQASATTAAAAARTPPEHSQVATPQRQDSTLDKYRSALAPLGTIISPGAILKTPCKRKQEGGRKAGVRTKRLNKLPSEDFIYY